MLTTGRGRVASQVKEFRYLGVLFTSEGRLTGGLEQHLNIWKRLRVEPLLLHVERKQLRWFEHQVRMPPWRSW